MAIFGNSEVTRAGHELLSKVLAGECKLKFTLMQAGDGFYSGDVTDLTELVNHRLDGSIVGVREMGMFTELDCKLTNQHLTAFLEFREIGIWANGMMDGVPIGDDILFAYANAGDNASPMGPFNGVWLHEEIFTIRIYTANATDIQAEITPSAFAAQITFNNIVSGLRATNIQDAIDELVAMHDLDAIIVHNLGAYPNVQAIEFEHGYGTGGYGEIPYGGSVGQEIRVLATYLDRDKLKAAVCKEFGPLKGVALAREREYVVCFVDSDLVLCLALN